MAEDDHDTSRPYPDEVGGEAEPPGGSDREWARSSGYPDTEVPADGPQGSGEPATRADDLFPSDDIEIDLDGSER